MLEVTHLPILHRVDNFCMSVSLQFGYLIIQFGILNIDFSNRMHILKSQLQYIPYFTLLFKSAIQMFCINHETINYEHQIFIIVRAP